MTAEAMGRAIPVEAIAADTKMKYQDILSNCTLCPRKCKADRLNGHRGYCGMDSTIWAARAALHMWEEPCISGKKGSGAVFFAGCGLRCCYCQNWDIAVGDRGKGITPERLSDIFLELEQKGAANINLVTGAHYVPQIVDALEAAKNRGLSISVVYNSSGYECAETLHMLNGLIDIYLPDLKYLDPDLAKKFSNAPDYPDYAKEAIKEMVCQTGKCEFGEDGYILKGTIVRHLILPGHTRNSIQVLEYLHKTYHNDIYISIMNQYTPLRHQERYEELNRRVTLREYEKVLNAALEMGIENGFFQEGETAKESFIPSFNCEGV